MSTTKTDGKAESTRVLISCDYRAEVGNSRIGMVLDSKSSVFELKALCARKPSIKMIDKSNSSVHDLEAVEAVYVKLAGFGGVYVFRKDGQINHINKLASRHQLTAKQIKPEELARINLVVGRPMPEQVSTDQDPIAQIVAVSSRTYTKEQIEHRTNGRKASFVLEAELFIENEVQWAGRG